MKNKNRINFILTIVMMIILSLMFTVIAFDIRNIGIRGAHEKAEAVANVVKIGLTSQMEQGTMAQRGKFIDQIESLQGMKQIWLTRSDSVIRQYGEGLKNEMLRDAIDERVLTHGIMEAQHHPSLFGEDYYRVTIPYRAQKSCLQCHEGNVGDTLGAISIEINLNEIKQYGLSTIGFTIMFAMVLTLFILTFVNRLIGPYLKIFDEIKQVMRRADQGDYTQRVEGFAHGESKEVAEWINALLSKLQKSLGSIEDQIRTFVAKEPGEDPDPLNQVETTVVRLAGIYRFRKTIEHDEQLETVYERFSHVLNRVFSLEDFNIFEASSSHKIMQSVYSHQQIRCDFEQACRADRTNSIVDSCQFEHLCQQMQDDDVQYVCVPFSISNDLDLVMSFVTHNKEEALRVRALLPAIQDYVDAAKPEIVSKKLMQTLEKSARTDALTGLFNRKYLEESIDKIVHQSNRSNTPYGVLMADIDHFKMINDTYGHDVGDEAIRIIAQTLEQCVRQSDLVVRYGGEEFIVLLYNCDADYVKSVAEKIRIAFSKKKIKAKHETFSKTISIGAAMFPKQSENFWQVIKYADVALYYAKNSGRNKVVLYDPSLVKEGEYDEKY